MLLFCKHEYMKTRWSISDCSNDRRRFVKTKDSNKELWGNAVLIVSSDKVTSSYRKLNVLCTCTQYFVRKDQIHISSLYFSLPL